MRVTPVALGRQAGNRFGALGGAFVSAVACFPVVLAVGLPLGFLAKAVEPGVDRPFWRWMQQNQGTDLITRQMSKVSNLGDIPTTQALGLLGAVVLAYAFGRRRWWIPVLVIGFAYVAERLMQQWLAQWVDRGYPVGATGTYPSGGVARTLTVYGAILACTLVLLPLVDRAGRRVAWSGLLVLAVLVGMSRLWLGKHWLSDVVAGFPFGLLILAFDVSILTALTTTKTTMAHDLGRT